MGAIAGSETLRASEAGKEAERRLRTTGLDRRLGLIAGIVFAFGAGVVAAWIAPRGPVTTSEALGWLVGSLAVGIVAGFASGTRWAAVFGPVMALAGFELARMGAVGPTVDAVHIGSTYGIIALVVGRGLTVALTLPAMVLGSLLGVQLAAWRHRPGATSLRVLGWLSVGLLTVAVAGLGVAFSRAATTPAIVGANGLPVPGSIAELASIPLGGRDQALLIRGRSTDAPVLLHLAGGPGGTDLGAMRGDVSLEDDFVVVTWDQRGTGKSYGALDPVDTLTPEQMVADTIELTEYLRERFDEDRIYLHGNSWGSLLGVLAVDARPDLYYAWVGTGQMVAPAETDRMFWEDTIAWSEAAGDEELVSTLRGNGPPPYTDVLDYEVALSHEHDWNPYPDWDSDKELPFTLFVPENTLMDQVNGLRAFLDTFAVLYPRIQDIDLREDAPSLQVPVYLVQGGNEARGRAVPADEWFAMLQAPAKEWIEFERSGHRPSFEEPGRFAEVMRRIRDLTYPAE